MMCLITFQTRPKKYQLLQKDLQKYDNKKQNIMIGVIKLITLKKITLVF